LWSLERKERKLGYRWSSELRKLNYLHVDKCINEHEKETLRNRVARFRTFLVGGGAVQVLCDL
jgi:1,4-dihydroxy-2-naphthoyl-CoA synthase